ncbi:MAG: MerR family transcriptional regulator [Candidatus Marinimicrobia bacterium]|nr:MerR family transcriptional regulator [Candidatus Neomarinimicrobiota bacterium]
MPLNLPSETDQYEPVISIGVAAKKLGISPETLRLYERASLILPYKTRTNRRLYSQKDLDWIRYFRWQITKQKLNFAGVRLLLALIPCWDLKPCTQEERSNCPAYMNGEIVCWSLLEHGSKSCDMDECQKCTVYRTACKAGKLNEIYLSVKN